MTTALPTRLTRLCARDIMSRDVVTLDVAETLQQAACRLRGANVTGAPVVNQEGRLVGILSATDVMTYEEQQPLPSDFVRAKQQDPKATVEEYMSAQVEAIADDTRLVNIAQKMCEGHRHRLVVVDREEQVCGIVSTMDILAALVGCVDEREASS